jgi:hypothetical protein
VERKKDDRKMHWKQKHSMAETIGFPLKKTTPVMILIGGSHHRCLFGYQKPPPKIAES